MTTVVEWALIRVLFILDENVGEVTSLIQQGGTCIRIPSANVLQYD